VPDPAAIEALRHSPVADLVRRCRLIAILRRVEPRERLLDLVASLAEDGVRLFEVTFDSPAAADGLVAVRDRLPDAGITDPLVGAGTITTLDRLEAAAQAGAAFIVAPTVDVEIVERAIELGLPVIPGAYSPTEIALAWRMGATFVKVFPASSVGPSHVRELRGPLPEIELIATGGVDAANARSFLAAGCVAIAAGGALVNGTPDERRAIVDAAT
jgi:2-dehydro-3-deoxyphosphogluconate aldolase / (4S)-4-hydroxy-2-oxoglutarate aldolase